MGAPGMGSSLPQTQAGALPPAPIGAPMAGAFGIGMPMTPPPPTVPPSIPPMTAPGAGGPSRAPQGSTISCPRCGTQTPLGFAYCQHCGLNVQGMQPTDPGAGARPRSPSGAPPIVTPSKLAAPVDPHAGTLAQDNIRAGGIMPPSGAAQPVPLARPSSQAGAAWGSAVLVNRDGSDGQRFSLSGEYLVVGRAGCDIAFDDDRFLARQHARLERAADGSVKVTPLDTLNGVFRKADAPVELSDGMTILVGREVLRYEKLDAEETKLHPLVRHGVALFGSPPREPWGRFVQIVPSGGYRDVRHLVGEEVVLGREEGDIVFRDDAFMSRRHAAVTWDGRRAQITDLGSSNGTFVRITGATPLKHGDHVRMGDQLLRIELGR